MQLFEDDDPGTVATIIRGHFKALGGNVPMRELATSVIEKHILPPGVVERCALRGVTEMCRNALSAHTREGLPYAQPTGDGGRDPWLTLDLFSHDKAIALIRRRAKGVLDDWDELHRLQVWCLERFGSAPDIPELVPVENEDDDAGEAHANP